jgi:hypothetical protein
MNAKPYKLRVKDAMQRVVNAAQGADKAAVDHYMTNAITNLDQIDTAATNDMVAFIDNGKVTVEGIISAREEIICEMCMGWGHKAK